jgi:hypothetical protein
MQYSLACNDFLPGELIQVVHGRDKEPVANLRSAVPADMVFMPAIIGERNIGSMAQVALHIAAFKQTRQMFIKDLPAFLPDIFYEPHSTNIPSGSESLLTR